MIDTDTFVYEDSRLRDIYMHLKNNLIDVYMPETKIGECKAPYVVIKNNGSSQHVLVSTDVDLYSVMVYVPKQAYSTLEPFVQSIKTIMKKLEPMILPYGFQSPSYYDDNCKAHMISIEYKNYKKML